MAALQKNRYQNLKEFCEALYSDFEDAGEEKKKPVSKSDGTLKSVNEEKEKAKSGQNALGTGMEKLQNLTKKQKMIAGAAVILVVLLIFAGTTYLVERSKTAVHLIFRQNVRWCPML